MDGVRGKGDTVRQQLLSMTMVCHSVGLVYNKVNVLSKETGEQ